MNIQHCTASQIETIINHHEQGGSRPSSFRLSCPVRDALKKSRKDKSANPYGVIVKHSHLSALVNFNYEGNVNAQRKREDVAPTFKAQQNWFEHVTPAIVAHRSTGERYVFIRVLSNLSAPTFTADGVEVERAALLPFLPASDLSDAERAAFGLDAAKGAENQGIEKEIAPIAIKLANVRQIVIDGFTYVATGDDVTPERITRTTLAPVHA